MWHHPLCFHTGDTPIEVEETTREQIVQYYTAVQQSNELAPPPTPNTRPSKSNNLERYYSNGTPAERYWSTQGAQGSNKRQNVSSMLQSIFPDGLAPLAQKVAAIERKEHTKAQRHTSRLAAARAASDAAMLSTDAADADSNLAAAHAAIERSITDSLNTALDAPSSQQDSTAAASLEGPAVQHPGASAAKQRVGKPSDVSFKVTAAESADGLQATATMQQTPSELRLVDSASRMLKQYPVTASTVNDRPGDGAVASGDADRTQRHQHYSRGQKLAAAILWETASGKSQPVRLRQCLTHSEIRMKNLSRKESAYPSRIEQQDSARIAVEV